VGLVARLDTAGLLNALVKLDTLLNRHRIGYIVIGSLADYLLGITAVRPNDIDILVSKENVEKLNIIAVKNRASLC